jgi:hypothetical protein
MSDLDDSLVEYHFDIVKFYTNAEKACQLCPDDLRDPGGQSYAEELIFELCEQDRGLRDAGVEYVLVCFNRAYAVSSNELIDGKFTSYHHAVFSLACDVVAVIRARLEAHPTDWIRMAEDLNRRALLFEQLEKVCDGILVRLEHELAVALNLQAPGSQNATGVATVGASASRSAAQMPDSKTDQALDVTEVNSTAIEELAETTVTRAELQKRLTVDIKENLVWFDKTPYDVSGDGALLFDQMRKSYPKPICASDTFSKPSRLKASLRKGLQDLIRTDPGKGYWLELPPAAPEIRP